MPRQREILNPQAKVPGGIAYLSSLVEINEARTTSVLVTEDSLSMDLADERTFIVPLAWFLRLWHGTLIERNRFELIGDGAIIRWLDLDEDLSISGLLAGRRSGESPESLKEWIESRRPTWVHRFFYWCYNRGVSWTGTRTDEPQCMSQRVSMSLGCLMNQEPNPKRPL